MGLDLEPQSTIDETEIGCRVVNFVFGFNHDGISKALLQQRVTMGDELVSIQDRDVRSTAFSEIVRTLAGLRSQTRRIGELHSDSLAHVSSVSSQPPAPQDFNPRSLS